MIKNFSEFINEDNEYLTRFRDDSGIVKVISISGFSEEYPIERVQKYLNKVGFETEIQKDSKIGDFLKWKSESDKTLNTMFTNITLKIKNSGFKGLKIWKSLPKGDPQFINESAEKYQVYHNLYSSAIETALEYAKSKGYTYDENETFNQIGLGPIKPKDGITNKFTIKLYKDGKEQKKCLQIQIYGMGNKYELNTYIA